MNVYDSERLADLLTANGYEEVPEAESADIILLNTCAVRENAKEKIYHQLGRWKELKKGNPRMIIGVGGCVASADGEEIFRRAPEVDIVFGPQTMHLVPGMIEKVIAGEGRQIDISFPELEKFNILPPIARGAPSAYVTITEGCSNFCTYCIVPFTRGPVVSRTVREIMEEVGLRVKNIKYRASQSWSFPNQLMLAFTAEYDSGEIREQAGEIAKARWFHRDALPEIPPKGSVAYNLITSYCGGKFD